MNHPGTDFITKTVLLVKHIFLLSMLVYILLPLVCQGQSDDKNDNVMDTTYIQEYPEKYSIRLLGVEKSFNLNVRTTQSDTLFQYEPRYRTYAGIGGFLWNIGFNILVPLSKPGEEEGVNLRRLNLQGSLFAHRWLLSGIYQRYKGYYIRPANQQQRFEREQFRAQMVSRKIEGSITYIPNGNKLSMRAPFNQSVRQIKSAGSFVMSGGFSYFRLSDERSVLPSTLQQREIALLSSLQLTALNTKVGYACSLVHRNFFLHLYGLTGLSFQMQKHQPISNMRSFAVRPLYDGRAAIGYDNGTFYSGVYAIADYKNFRFEQLRFGENTTQIRLFVGVRLQQPDWLKKLKPDFLEKWQNSPSLPFPSIFE